MANFPTHIVVGTVVAGSLATLTLAADVIAPENLIAVTMAGSLGSVLPDIDLKDSRPSRALFAGLAVFFSFALLFHFAPKLSIAEMWILWLATLLFVRFGLHTAFHRLTMPPRRLAHFDCRPGRALLATVHHILLRVRPPRRRRLACRRLPPHRLPDAPHSR